MDQHDDIIKWKHFPRYWPFVQGIHRPPVNSPHKGQWRGALMFSLICAWTNSSANNQDAGGLRCRCAHYDVTVMNAIYSKLGNWKHSTRTIFLFSIEINFLPHDYVLLGLSWREGFLSILLKTPYHKILLNPQAVRLWVMIWLDCLEIWQQCPTSKQSYN